VILYDKRGHKLITKQSAVKAASSIRLVKTLVDPQRSLKIGKAEFVFVNRVVQQAEKEQQAFVLRFIIASGLLLLLLLFMLTRAFKPLDTLMEWIRNFDPKVDDISSMPDADCKEARTIEGSMVQMFERIRHYTSELDSLNRHLDEKVRQRTDALSEANAQLKEEVRIREAAENALKAANMRLTELSRIDMLTGIANRRHFEEHLQESWSVCVRERIPISLIICDIDHFKRVNDTYGHPAGDVVIKYVARTLKEEIKRASDMVARYGGEEFAIILFDTTLEDALSVLKTLQRKVSSIGTYPSPAEGVGTVTLSFGVCSHMPSPSDSAEKCVSAADRALYQAKEAGRDRIMSVAYRD
jgi:diguanylate cyclase (GGDEF)-like protein